MTPTRGVTIRESSDRDQRRNIIVIIGPGALIGFRLKGCRRTFETTIGACYSIAVKQCVAAEKAKKAAARKAKGRI